MIKITVPHALLDASADIRSEANLALAKGATVHPDGDNAIYTITPSKFPLDKAKSLSSVGCTIEHMPLFIEIVSADDNVTAGLPNAEGNTWQSWLLPNHSILERDGRLFVGTNANSGNDLEVGVLTPVFDSLIVPADIPLNEDPTT